MSRMCAHSSRRSYLRSGAKLSVALTFGVGAILAMPSLALADGEGKKDCEPGSWFCGETHTQGGGSGGLQPLPSEKTEPRSDRTPPPVVVYQPPPPTVVIQPRDAPPAYYYVPRKAPPRQEWGLNLHAGGTMMGDGRDGNAGMVLGGLGLRYRPIPQAAIEGVLDFAGGRDYNGYRRNETSFSLNALVFLNPKNTTQVYLLGGFGWSGATAVDDRSGTDQTEYKYTYFGMQAGIGLEFRLSRVIALNVDMRGLVRGRIDRDAREHPEFVSADGKSTNTSGAGLLQGGITFYW